MPEADEVSTVPLEITRTPVLVPEKDADGKLTGHMTDRVEKGDQHSIVSLPLTVGHQACGLLCAWDKGGHTPESLAAALEALGVTVVPTDHWIAAAQPGKRPLAQVRLRVDDENSVPEPEEP